MKVTFQLESLTCPSCIQKIESALSRTTGVLQYKVLFNASKVKVTFDSSLVSVEDLSDTIGKLGYPPVKTIVK